MPEVAGVAGEGLGGGGALSGQLRQDSSLYHLVALQWSECSTGMQNSIRPFSFVLQSKIQGNETVNMETLTKTHTCCITLHLTMHLISLDCCIASFTV